MVRSCSDIVATCADIFAMSARSCSASTCLVAVSFAFCASVCAAVAISSNMRITSARMAAKRVTRSTSSAVGCSGCSFGSSGCSCSLATLCVCCSCSCSSAVGSVMPNHWRRRATASGSVACHCFASLFHRAPCSLICLRLRNVS